MKKIILDIALRAGILADASIKSLRLQYPTGTRSKIETNLLIKESGLTRGDMIAIILVQEFGKLDTSEDI